MKKGNNLHGVILFYNIKTALQNFGTPLSDFSCLFRTVIFSNQKVFFSLEYGEIGEIEYMTDSL